MADQQCNDQGKAGPYQGEALKLTKALSSWPSQHDKRAKRGAHVTRL